MPRMTSASINGLTIWKVISASMIVIFFFLLTNVSLCTAQQFCSTQIFETILIASFLMVTMIMVLQFISGGKLGQLRNKILVLFFFREWKWRNLLYIPLGLIFVFGGAFAGSAINSPLMSIGIAGVVMLFTLYRTNTVLVPIMIHGIYNSIIIYLRTGGVSASLVHTLSLSTTFVPSFGNNLASYYGLTTEIVFQVFLVAVAEEMFKIFVIIFAIVGTEGNFDVKNKPITWISGIAAVILWVSMHVIANNYT